MMKKTHKEKSANNQMGVQPFPTVLANLMPARHLPLVAKSAIWPSDLKYSESVTESSAHSHTHSQTECLSQSPVESCAESFPLKMVLVILNVPLKTH